MMVTFPKAGASARLADSPDIGTTEQDFRHPGDILPGASGNALADPVGGG